MNGGKLLLITLRIIPAPSTKLMVDTVDGGYKTELTYPQASPWDSLFLLKPDGFT